MGYNVSKEDLDLISSGIIEEVGRVRAAKIYWHLSNFYKVRGIAYTENESEFKSNIEKVKSSFSGDIRFIVTESGQRDYWVSFHPEYIIKQSTIDANKSQIEFNSDQKSFNAHQRKINNKMTFLAFLSALFVLSSVSLDIFKYFDKSPQKVQIVGQAPQCPIPSALPTVPYPAPGQSGLGKTKADSSASLTTREKDSSVHPKSSDGH